MAKRIIEIVLPEGRADDIAELLYERNLDDYGLSSLDNNRAKVRILLNRNEVEPVLDILEPYLETLPESSAVLLNVEASIPRTIKSNGSKSEKESKSEEQDRKSLRISRHELYNDITINTGVTGTYLAMVILSAVVAAIGLIRNDMAIIIGAMVMAPLLVPNVAVALANTLGDTDLLVKGINTTGTGFLLALLVSVTIGMFFQIDPSAEAITARTNIRFSDIVLAMASGTAGVLAFTSGGQLSLIGVMVAVALMPPLVSAGLLIGSGNLLPGINALELTFANVICVNIAGIVTFIMQGISPATWWEKDKARSAKRKALLLWSLLLIILSYFLLR